MTEYCLEIAGLKRNLPLIEINRDLAFASFVVISDTELISTVAPILAEKIRDCDIIVTAEAKGIALAYEISRQLGHKEFIVVRKSAKSYMRDPLEVSVRSITTFSQQHMFLDANDQEKMKGRKVCLLDDVVSTGESLTALETLVEHAGAIVHKKACILAEGNAAERSDIIFLEKLPLFRKNQNGEYEEID